jgi:hypothetical protein
MYYLIDQGSPIMDSLLKIKHAKMYRGRESIKNPTYIYDINLLYDLIPNTEYILSPTSMYSIPNIFEKIHMILETVFYFSDEVKNNALNSLNTNNEYISIHLRLGDYYLETDPFYVICKTDKREYSEDDLFAFIEKNSHKNIAFFCDNLNYKRSIKNKYNFINITDFEIGHTGLSNTTYTQILNTVTEFYLLSNSECIYVGSNSGFPIMSSKFKNIPIRNINDFDKE